MQEENLLHVCHIHHGWIHANPNAARALGYLGELPHDDRPAEEIAS